MAQLIEVDADTTLPPQVAINTGDVLLFKASGGYVVSGSGIIEQLGPFTTGVLHQSGQVLAPMGGPGTIMFAARQPGRAIINVVTGDPWYNPANTELEVLVRS